MAASVTARPGGASLPRALKASTAARRIRSIRAAERARRKNPKEDELIARASPCGSFRVFNKWHAVIAGLQILLDTPRSAHAGPPPARHLPVISCEPQTIPGRYATEAIPGLRGVVGQRRIPRIRGRSGAGRRWTLYIRAVSSP